jgi:hypothetical protein
MVRLVDANLETSPPDIAITRVTKAKAAAAGPLYSRCRSGNAASVGGLEASAGVDELGDGEIGALSQQPAEAVSARPQPDYF